MEIKIGDSLWFIEVSDLWPGRALAVEIEEVLYKGKSKYQDIAIYQTKHLGKMLVLDYAIQLTQSDEMAYHEMFVHVPLNGVNFSVERVLVVGGGDGGLLREISRYKEIKQIDIVEIDEEVIRVSKEYLKFTSIGFDDSRVNVYIEDGFKFLDEREGYYDIILVDSSDPEGPAESLFRSDFYKKLYRALKDRGVVVTQGESIWLHFDKIIKPLIDDIKNIFDRVDYYKTQIPTYPSGMIGYIVGIKGDFSIREPKGELEFQNDLRYYTPQLHKEAFVFPYFIEKQL